MARAELLVVEDEPEMAAVLRQGFEQDHYGVQLAGDGQTALALAGQRRYDAIILDVMLPVMDGFAVARALRQGGNLTPVLMLTARDSISDVVLGLESGAADYVTKPFSFLELAARVKALMRRNGQTPEVRRIADLVLDPVARAVTRGTRRIHLTPTEFLVLEALFARAGSVVPRIELRHVAWGGVTSADDNNLDVTMSALRSKIDKGCRPKLIHTVRGFGYRLADTA